MERFATMTTDELADGICLRAGQIAAAEAEHLAWIGEFDRREGWAGAGMLSCAHWLSWRIGLSLSTAREQVRVARRLPELPEVETAYAEGRVSYSKVRAVTRVADPGDGIDWVELARHSSAAQLETIARGVRRAQANEAAAADPEAAAWSLRTRTRYDDQGNFVLTISGPAEFLPVLRAGIDAKKAELEREREAAAPAESAAPSASAASAALPAPDDASAEASRPTLGEHSPSALASADLDEQARGWPVGTSRRDALRAVAACRWTQDQRDEPTPAATGEREPGPAGSSDVPAEARPDASAEAPTTPPVTDAEALLALAEDALAAEQSHHPAAARRRRPQLTAQVDPLSGWARQVDGELLPPSSLRQVMASLPGRGGVLRLRLLTARDLRRHDLGRSSRLPSQALRELIGALDGERCRFPGCTRRRKLHAHHVRYWSAGGRTDLDNLVLVCSRHHTLVHASGFALVLHPDRRLDGADGRRDRAAAPPRPAVG